MKKLENGTKYQKRCFSIQIEKFSEHQNIAEKDGWIISIKAKFMDNGPLKKIIKLLSLWNKKEKNGQRSLIY